MLVSESEDAVHTPGPWRLGRDVTSVGRLVYIAIKANKHIENKNRVFSTTNATGPNKSEIIATTGVYAHNPDNGRTIGDTYKELGEIRYRPFITDDECRANARLIAAAPELLEALKQARSRLIQAYAAAGGDDEASGNPNLQHDRKVIGITDAAIAKAEGG